MRAIVAAGLLLPAFTLAQAPQLIGYQGRLLKSDGIPQTGATITFAIYAAETRSAGEQPLWSEVHQVALTNGFYAVFLGNGRSTTQPDQPAPPFPSALFDGSRRWLELTVAGDAGPLTPRQLIASVPYALRAANAAHATSADQATNATNVAGGTVSASSISSTGTVRADGDLLLNGKVALRGSDGWLRLNQDGAFTSGIHSPLNLNVAGLTVGAGYYHPGQGNIVADGTISGGAIVSGTVSTSGVSVTHGSPEGPGLRLVNASKTGPGIGNTWVIYNMTGSYSNSLQFWSYDNVNSCGGGLCGPQMRISDTGGVWISGALTQNSVRASKTKIRELDIEDAMQALQGLHPVRYEYKADPGNGQVGFIAEDMPGLLSTKDRSGVRTLDVVAVLTRVLKAQQAEIAALKARLDSQRR